MNPSISVIIPYYNGSRFIDEAVASVQAQTYPASEIIIVNDGSRPEEAAHLRRHRGPCTVIDLPDNRGVSMARNIGVAHATGDWLAFLDCDDLWAPHKLQTQVDYIRRNPGCRAVHTALRGISQNGQVGIFPKTPVGVDDFLYNDWSPVLPSTLLVEREAFIACGLFNPTVRATEDHECFLRFCRFYPIHCVNEPLVTRRIQPDGLSRNVELWVEGQDRTIRYYQRLYPSRAAYRRRLVQMHASILPQLLYRRQLHAFSRIVRQSTAHDLPLLRLGPHLIAMMLRYRLRRASPAGGLRGRGAGRQNDRG
ncbi:MAG: glycosyltransferase family A protein [Myxococcales bacterium]|nr:glycosyltransferase family 2 protein [Myxococcota bacterium]MDW8281803.1 glycosyltransferase family A protein [Myxococcales bacterium]